jgi:hypothetical protein
MDLPPADPNLVVKVARLGPLGRCLEEALNELMSRDAEAEMDDINMSMQSASEEEHLSARIRQSIHTTALETPAGIGNDEHDASCDASVFAERKELLREACEMDRGMVECLMNTLGESVAQTRWNVADAAKEEEEEEEDSTTLTTTANRQNTVAPPKALMRGRVDHFNRVSGKWRIVATNVEIRPRVNLDTTHKKRKRDRSSLWDTSGNAIMEDPSENSIQLKGTVQILAYDDV